MDFIKRQFLKDCGIEFTELVALPQDASSKTFDRVIVKQPLGYYTPNSGQTLKVSEAHNYTKEKSLILMHYPDEDSQFAKFISVSQALLKNQILAPEVFGYNEEHSLVLLEDFGDISVNKYINQNPDQRLAIYKEMIDIMWQMQNVSHIYLGGHHQSYPKELLLKELRITINWYFPYLGIKNTDTLAEDYLAIWSEILDNMPKSQEVFVHRDFHVDNLFVIARGIGVLDFQDCLFGSPIYDLVSLLDDARTDVPTYLRDELIGYYVGLSRFAVSDVMTEYNILGAQRNSRILGVFARKAVHGNESYLQFMPRVTGYLKNNLSAPELGKLRAWLNQNIWSNSSL
jgi:aminoglycoside/choline kinase family phosphotransferase